MNSAARTIQGAWRRTANRLGRIGGNMKDVPLKKLHQILLQISARNREDGVTYHVNNNGHMIRTSASGYETRINRQNVIRNIAMMTKIRPAVRNRAARVIQAHARGARARREAALRRTPFGKGLPRNVLNRIFKT